MKIEKVEKLVANLLDKTEYVIHIRNLKQALNHGLVSKKVHRVIKFNQNAWLKPYRKIPLIRPGPIYRQRTNLIGLYSGRLIYEGAFTREKKTLQVAIC